jgi:hypothetical protein
MANRVAGVERMEGRCDAPADGTRTKKQTAGGSVSGRLHCLLEVVDQLHDAALAAGVVKRTASVKPTARSEFRSWQKL